jgi:hypothetical protein
MKNDLCIDGFGNGRFASVSRFLLCAGILLWLHSGSLAAEPAPRFNRDIRPILAENCLACHGPDPGSRKAGLRLDMKEGMFETTPKHGPAVVPGDLAKSELWKRITTGDADDVMPPPKSKKELKSAEKEALRAWILAGAPWEGHWAFIKPERPQLPPTKNQHWVRNPIDSFILAKLEGKGLVPAPEADHRALARRLALDLTGLPPAPEEVERFVKDRSADAYEKLVARLMDSPHWGEHRARYWLDAARYADTHGLHFDNYREMWPYRDYVIRTFNLNRHFDRFITEQLAGDLLENSTDDELVATGFQRCNVTTNEGGTIEEENLTNYANDRVTTVGWTFLGLTVNCGACHDHKFDPFTTKDFYSLAAFFRNTKQGGFDRNRAEGDLPLVMPQTTADHARWKALPAEIATARKVREEQQSLADATFTNWVATAEAAKLPKTVEYSPELLRLPLTEGRGTNAAGLVNGRSTRFSISGEPAWRTDGPLGAAPVIEPDRSVTLGDVGNFEAGEPFSLGAWVWVPEDFKGEGSILARMNGEKERHRGWDFFARDDHFGIYLIHSWPSVALKVRSQDKTVKRGGWHHLFATYDGSTRADGVKLYIDGLEAAVNRERDSLEGTVRTTLPLRLGRREEKNELKGAAVQDVRIYSRRLDASEVAVLAATPRLAQLLPGVEFASTNNPARDVMRHYFRATQHVGWRESAATLLSLEGERQAIRARSPYAHIQQEKKDSQPIAQILFRGQYDKPKEKVTAAVPAALHPMPPNAPQNRLGLAEWLVSPGNPLTARVTVNRFWQEVFGTGLVKTVEDFGTMGEAPVNQALLDWLAVEFIESGWDVRHLFKLIVTSAAYRQSAESTPEKLEKDPQNRFLSRGPRFRMDAEMLRDYALAASGLLVDKVGGPSVKPYQPGGVWEAVAMPESNTRYYEQDSGDGLYRRSLYTFWKRAAPPASMDIFNAPSRETCSVRRERTDTPLQALVTLNDPQFIEAARHLAETALLRSRGREVKQIDFLARRLLLRPLTPVEEGIVLKTLAGMTEFYDANPAEAAKLIAVGDSTPSPKVKPAQLAALTMVANQLLNLDEVLNK